AAGGPVILSYMLLLNLPKEQLIGTSAFFCFLVDIMKLPLYILIWHNITAITSVTSLLMSPLIVLGFILGLFFVRKFTNQSYRKFILAISFVSAIRLFF
ncbi:MAG: TSUP family transporter, partial [Spirochaetia bacterium]|nr:TSUP family transporter [Spirochaetia bacterium]